MSNDKLAEALRACMDVMLERGVPTHPDADARVAYTMAEEALQAHAAEAAQSDWSRATARCYLGDLTDAEADLAVRAYHLGAVNGHFEPNAEYSDALQLAEEDRALEDDDSADDDPPDEILPLYTRPQPAQDAKDAARYRFLADHQDADLYMENPGKELLDRAVDVAMAKESGR